MIYISAYLEVLKLLKIAYWVLLVGTIVVFWISLRSPEDGLYYTLVAVVFWATTYGLHRFIKMKEKQQEE